MGWWLRGGGEASSWGGTQTREAGMSGDSDFRVRLSRECGDNPSMGRGRGPGVGLRAGRHWEPEAKEKGAPSLE